MKFLNNKLTTIIIAGSIIEILCIAIAYNGDIKKDTLVFAVLYTAQFVVYFFTVLHISRNTDICEQDAYRSGKVLWAVIVCSLLFRFTLLPMTPSDDVYRYLWEGKLQWNLVNPYSYPPESSSLEHLRDAFYTGINHKHLSTIYPPLTLMVFAITDYVSHSLPAMKCAFLLFDILSIFVLLKLLKVMKKDLLHVLIYAWSPLVLISFAARGHCDSLQVFLLSLALYFCAMRKSLRSIISIGLATLSKFIFVIIAPFLVRGNNRKYFLVLPAVISVLYLPYISAGKGLFSTLFHFGTHYHFNDSAHFLISRLCFNSHITSEIITALLFATVLFLLYKKHLNALNSEEGIHGDSTIINYAFLSIGAFLILTPTLHPWYLTWIVPFLCFNKNRAWLLLTGTVVFYYFMNHELFSQMIWYNNEWVWKEVHWLKLPEYLPFYGLLIYGWLKAGTESNGQEKNCKNQEFTKIYN